MALSTADMQVLTLAVNRAEKSGQAAMHVRTAAVLELGGESILSDQDKARYSKTPDDGKKLLTSSVPVKGMKQLLGS